MKYTFVELKHVQTGNWPLEHYQKMLSPLEIDQLRIAVKPHAELYDGNVDTFEKCFFPVYPNNEGGVEYVRYYKVMNENGLHAFDLVRIEMSGGAFFEPGTAKQCFFLWAGKLAPHSPQMPETTEVLKAFELMNK